MSRKGTFSSGNTCEVFTGASVCIEHTIASLGLSLSRLCISCHHPPQDQADAHRCDQLLLVVPAPRKPQSHHSKDVGLPPCVACSYVSTVSQKESIIVMGLEIRPKIKMLIQPHAKGPPISSSGQKYFPSVFFQHSTIYSSWVFPSGLASWIFSPSEYLICAWIHVNFLHPVFFRKESHRSTTCHAKTMLVHLFWIICMQTLLGKCSKNIWNKLIYTTISKTLKVHPTVWKLLFPQFNCY